jgi:hypothetical protein
MPGQGIALPNDMVLGDSVDKRDGFHTFMVQEPYTSCIQKHHKPYW